MKGVRGGRSIGIPLSYSKKVSWNTQNYPDIPKTTRGIAYSLIRKRWVSRPGPPPTPKKIFGKDKVISRRGIRLLKLFGVVQSNPVNIDVLPVQPVHSLPFSLLFASSLGAFLYGQGAQHTSATIFLGPDVSENSLMASLFQLTSFISFLKNCLIWARGWKSSGSRPLMGGFTPRETMAKAFLVSKRTGRIWAEYLRRIQFIRPLGWGTTLGLHLSTFLELLRHLFHTRCAVFLMPQNRVRRGAGLLSRIASRQAATIATNYFIWSHEFIIFTTSKFPPFCSSYILPYLQVSTTQSHATRLDALCEIGTTRMGLYD